MGFGFVFAQSQAADGHAPSPSLAKTPKSLAAERLQFFFKRSGRFGVTLLSATPWSLRRGGEERPASDFGAVDLWGAEGAIFFRDGGGFGGASLREMSGTVYLE